MLEFHILSSSGRHENEIEINSHVYDLLTIRNYAYKNPSMKVLVDTGAFLPTWVDGMVSFFRLFPKCKKINAQAILKGFGKSYEVVSVYEIPVFRLEDNTGKSIEFRNMNVAFDQPQLLIDIHTFAQI